MPQELKPCPYCGNRELGKEAYGAEVWIQCYACEMRGPTMYSQVVDHTEAIEAWNALPRTPDPLTKPNMTTPEDWLTDVEAAARGGICRSGKRDTTGAVQHVKTTRMYKVGVVMHEMAPWFIARDVFNVLGILGNRIQIMDSIANEDKALVETDDNGFPIKLSVINVNGLRALEEQGKMLKGCSCSD